MARRRRTLKLTHYRLRLQRVSLNYMVDIELDIRFVVPSDHHREHPQWLRLRETAVQALAEASGARLSIRPEIEGQLRQAEREIDRYC